jgi:hypothetical protein
VTRPPVVLLGMLTKIPVAGPAWLVIHYMEAFRRLGYDPWYVEAHSRTPSMFMRSPDDDGSARAAEYVGKVLGRFGFGNRWAFHALHEDGTVYGLSESRLRRLYRSAELVLNLHGGTVPLPEHVSGGPLVYLETDPVELEVELHDDRPEAWEFVKPHSSFFTWGLNYGADDCLVPVPPSLEFMPSPPPVLLDEWSAHRKPPAGPFTTIGNWEQRWREVTLDGVTYHWSKHFEFMKVLDLPQRTSVPLELALASYREEDRTMLEQHGWRVRPGLGFSADLDAYRTFIQLSRGEFSVAKDQNVRLRSGWFSERSATYLAAGRPVILQDTGFGSYLPTGEGLLSFNDLDSAAAALEAVAGDYERHSRAAEEIAREYLDAERVVQSIIDRVATSPRASAEVTV